MSDTLERLSEHLDLLAGQIFNVEEALGLLLQNKDQTATVSITKFQSLDFARQSLEDCALLLHLLSDEPSTRARLTKPSVDIAEKLKLDATKGLLGAGHLRKIDSDGGEFDLF